MKAITGDIPRGGAFGKSFNSRDQNAKTERRRLQNRRNARAWRHRQRMIRDSEESAQREGWEKAQLTAEKDFVGSIQTPTLDFTELIKISREQSENNGKVFRQCHLSHPDLYHLLTLFESAAYRSYCGNPQVDHRLTLVRLNVFRAFVRNMTALGYTREWMTDDSPSRFSVMGPHPEFQNAVAIPASLQPTILQRKQPHHPWLDFFPFARLRDNLIRHADLMDNSQLCRDLMGFWTMPDEENCMIVWGDPWDPMNWEITETFLHRWGWLVKGCPEIIWSTNFWRRVRGEKRLAYRVSFDEKCGSATQP
ncbi:uncharacterized protein N7511_008238 [Penicillium nucicola]|uniref:uncharacterized protein n=1 Tax=Penicillium nucicola TaxID=1850975 RepID=UPI002545A3FA|nr:uncharacterized protein N7511_008238 [Penicillium nucicola]KAJ5754085.1 hypothetical protein N7511_008238 [Penicillium nucicola]